MSKSYDSRGWTWAMLLAHWVRLAQSASAWPESETGGKLKASVPDLVMLQAVWFSLSQLTELSDPAERALGLDRAAWLIEKHRTHLQQLWSGQIMPQGIQELIDDAQAAWRQAKSRQDAAGGWLGEMAERGRRGGMRRDEGG